MRIVFIHVRYNSVRVYSFEHTRLIIILTVFPLCGFLCLIHCLIFTFSFCCYIRWYPSDFNMKIFNVILLLQF